MPRQVVATAPERKRIVESLIQVVAERGYDGASVQIILRRTRLTQGAFNRYFRSKKECFLVAWDEINEELVDEFISAYNEKVDWPDRLRAGLEQAAAYMRKDPLRAKFALEAIGFSHAAIARRDLTIRALASMIDVGCAEARDSTSVSRLAVEAFAARFYLGLITKVADGDDVNQFVRELWAIVALQFFGADYALEQFQFESESNAALDGARTVDDPRNQILWGFAGALQECRVSDITVTDIVRNAHVPRRRFYEYFASAQDCRDAAIDMAVWKIREHWGVALAEADSWLGGLGAAISACLKLFADKPELARLVMIDMLHVGLDSEASKVDAIEGIALTLRTHRERLGESKLRFKAFPLIHEEAIASGLFVVAARHLLSGGPASIEPLLHELTQFAQASYAVSASSR